MFGSTATREVGLSPEARIERAGTLDRPTKRDEAWRYAPHGALARLTFGPSPVTAADLPSGIEALIPEVDGPRIVLVNGVVDLARSELGTLPAGLVLTPLAPLASLVGSLPADAPPEPVAAHFRSGIDDHDDVFAAMNTAYGTDGAFVDVADGTGLTAPIHIVDIALPGAAGNIASTGVVVRLGEHATATVVETRIGGGDGFGGSSTRTTIALGVGANLDHLLVQDLPSGQIHLGQVRVTQAGGSDLRARLFNLGASYGRLAYDVYLVGPGARVDLAGLYHGTADQILDQQIRVIHGAPDCVSRQAFRGVLDDASTGVFNGGIDVRPGADGTDAAQSNDNLLLSGRAEANTQPRLEILADDVACKHGATVGQLDDIALYYLRSRGIPVDEARRLLVDAFTGQVVDEVRIDAVRAWISRRCGGSDA